MSEIFPVVASDEYAEKHLSLSTLQPSIISKWQLPVSFTILSEVHIAQLGDLFKERYEIIPKSSVKLPEKLLGQSRLHAWYKGIVNCRPSLQKHV